MKYKVGQRLFLANTAQLAINKVRIIRREEGVCGLHYEHYWIVGSDEVDDIAAFQRATRVTDKQLYLSLDAALKYLYNYAKKRLEYEKQRVQKLEDFIYDIEHPKKEKSK